MAADPLSTATRATKRNLLAVSSAVILIKVFDVAVERIPVGGVALAFDRGAVMFALVAALTYFLVAFAMYYWIDIKDIKETEYEVKLGEWYTNSSKEYRRIKSIVITKHGMPIIPDNHKIIFGHGVIEETMEVVEKPFAPSPKELSETEHSKVFRFRIIDENDEKTRISIMKKKVEMPELSKKIEEVILRNIRRYRWLFLLAKIRFFLVFFVKKSVFVFRNYGFDGLLPVAVAVTALAAAYNVVDLSWLKGLVPPVQP